MFGAPIINDITTTYPNEPQFIEIARSRPDKDYKYPAEFFDKQKAYYLDLKMIAVDAAPEQVFAEVEKLARTLKGWEVLFVDKSALRIEAISKTALMGFIDDVVIELRHASARQQTEIHMRSKSRVGKGDFGANAKRIQNFLKEIELKFKQQGSDK